MTKNEFMTRLEGELRRRNIPDAADVAAEYEQHFACRLADGYSEEEIAAKLGDPAALAAQFEETGAAEQKAGRKALLTAGLGLLSLIACMVFVMLIGFGIVLAAASLSFAAAAVCLLGNISISGLIPAIPYGCGAVLALALAALAVLTGAGCIYYAAFLKQASRAYIRYIHNTRASATGGAVLPGLTAVPRFSAGSARRLCRVILVSLTAFAVLLILSLLICSLTAGGFDFWHIWGWFR